MLDVVEKTIWLHSGTINILRTNVFIIFDTKLYPYCNCDATCVFVLHFCGDKKSMVTSRNDHS